MGPEVFCHFCCLWHTSEWPCVLKYCVKSGDNCNWAEGKTFLMSTFSELSTSGLFNTGWVHGSTYSVSFTCQYRWCRLLKGQPSKPFQALWTPGWDILTQDYNVQCWDIWVFAASNVKSLFICDCIVQTVNVIKPSHQVQCVMSLKHSKWNHYQQSLTNITASCLPSALHEEDEEVALAKGRSLTSCQSCQNYTEKCNCLQLTWPREGENLTT